MAKTMDKLGENLGMQQIKQISGAVFSVFALVFIPAVFAYL